MHARMRILGLALATSVIGATAPRDAGAQWDGTPNLYQYQGCSEFGCHLMSLTIGRLVAGTPMPVPGGPSVWWGMSWSVDHDFVGPVGGWEATPLRYDFFGGGTLAPPAWWPDDSNAGPCGFQVPHPGPWTCTDTPFGGLVPTGFVPAGYRPDYTTVTLALTRPVTSWTAIVPVDLETGLRTVRLDAVPGTTAPEPATVTLFATGALALGLAARRRRGA